MAKYLTDSDLAEIVRPIAEACPDGSIWAHNKSGGEYVIDGVAIAEGSQEPVVIYHANRNGAAVWVRVARDFMDGRFVRVSERKA
jgi:hypothetical protein